jgi:hypothetical protein
LILSQQYVNETHARNLEKAKKIENHGLPEGERFSGHSLRVKFGRILIRGIQAMDFSEFIVELFEQNIDFQGFSCQCVFNEAQPRGSDRKLQQHLAIFPILPHCCPFDER